MYSFMPQALKFPRQSALVAYTGPISVANCGIIFVFDIRHPNMFMVTMFWEFLKDGVDPYSKIKHVELKTERTLRGTNNPHLKVIYPVLKTERALRGTSSPHSKVIYAELKTERALRGTSSPHSKVLYATLKTERALRGTSILH
jgi:hypothetical protein